MEQTQAEYGGEPQNGLFEGTKFWLAQRVPQRNRYMQLIKDNGGAVVPLEQMADLLIFDHMRRDIPSAGYSYEYIEKSVMKGRLENLEDFACGIPASQPRPVGSSRPAKHARTPFTAEDDLILYKWVHGKSGKESYALKGNVIYQQLAQQNPRHTAQSWRDRWIKYVSQRPPPAEPVTDTLLTPPQEQVMEQQVENVAQAPSEETEDGYWMKEQRRMEIRTTDMNENLLSTRPATKAKDSQSGRPFTTEETELLLNVAYNITQVEESQIDKAWESFASSNPNHTASEWKYFFTLKVLPVFEKSIAQSITAYRKAASPKSSQKLPADSPQAMQELHGGAHFRHADLRGMTESEGVESSSNSPQSSQEATLVESTHPTIGYNVRKNKRVHDIDEDPRPKKRRRPGKPNITDAAMPSAPPHDDPRQSIKSSSHRLQVVTDSIHPLNNSETQDLFWDATQNPQEFDLPPPPGGWDDRVTDIDNGNDYSYQHDEFETAPTGFEEQVVNDVEVEHGYSSVWEQAVNDDKVQQEYSTGSGQAVNDGEDEYQRSTGSEQVVDDGESDHESSGGSERTKRKCDPNCEFCLAERQDAGNDPQDTQGLFISETQEIDTTLAPPPEGWSFPGDSAAYEGEGEEEEEEGEEEEVEEVVEEAVEEAVEEVVEEAVEAVVEEAPQPVQKFIFPPRPAATDSEVEAVEAWIKYYTTHDVHPFSEDVALRVLKMTTFRLRVANRLLREIWRGNGIPTNATGVWTEDDDMALESADSRAIAELERKHHRHRMDERFRFLQDYRR